MRGPGAVARSLGAAGARTDRPLPRRLGRLFPTPTLLLRAPCRSPFHLPPARRSHVTLPRPAPPLPRPPRGRLPKSGGSERGERGEGTSALRSGAGRAVSSVGVCWPRARGADNTRGIEVGLNLVVALVVGAEEGDWDASCVVVESGAWSVELWPRSREGHSYCTVKVCVCVSREVPTCARYQATLGLCGFSVSGWMDG